MAANQFAMEGEDEDEEEQESPDIKS